MSAEEKPASLFHLAASFEPPRENPELGPYKGSFVALRGSVVVASSQSISLLMDDPDVDLSRDLLIFVDPK